MRPKLIKTESRISLRLNTINQDLNTLPLKAYNFFKQETPIDTGNARNKTSLKNDVIRAEYPYAGKLNRGYSKQAPRGMTKPTLEYLRNLVRKTFGR
jgi:hypothetical protein